MGKVYRQTNLENLEQAFGVAERDLGVTRLLDPEGKTGQSPFNQKNQTCSDSLVYYYVKILQVTGCH